MGLRICVVCGSSYWEMLVAKIEHIIRRDLMVIVCSQEPLSPHTPPAPESFLFILLWLEVLRLASYYASSIYSMVVIIHTFHITLFV